MIWKRRRAESPLASGVGATGPVEVFQPATPETFSKEGYLLANPDVGAHLATRLNPRAHFDKHGRQEGRRQVSPAFLSGRPERNRRKFQRFESVLERNGEGAGFRFLGEPGAFPVAYGGRHHDLGSYDAESANIGFGPFIDLIEANPGKLYLDVGAGLRQTVHENCLYLEVYPSLTADVVVEPDRPYPIASNSLDGIGCFAVLEHVAEPWAVAAELRRMLKPGGLIFVDWPFLQPVHGYPSHYYNATRYGLQRLFSEGFDPIELATHPNQSADHTIHWLLKELAGGLDQGKRAEFLGRTVGDLIAEAPSGPWWSSIVAALPERTQLALACGNTLVARKR